MKRTLLSLLFAAGCATSVAAPPPPSSMTACAADRECARVDEGCCKLGRYVAVRADQADAYRASLHCKPGQMCPMIRYRDDHSQAECLMHKCTLVKPEDIRCGAEHACPTGWSCEGGTCRQPAK